MANDGKCDICDAVKKDINKIISKYLEEETFSLVLNIANYLEDNETARERLLVLYNRALESDKFPAGPSVLLTTEHIKTDIYLKKVASKVK